MPFNHFDRATVFYRNTDPVQSGQIDVDGRSLLNINTPDEHAVCKELKP
jgi:hypothetical protein